MNHDHDHDHETIAVYDAEAATYESIMSRGDRPGMDAFIDALPENASVLDFGCGPGLDAKSFQDAGFRVHAIDGSQEMVARANALGVLAEHAYFEELSDVDTYDGIWANFSLLHADRDALPGIFQKLRAALRRGGVFHIGMKLGDGEQRDSIGRLYNFFNATELDRLLVDAGFTPGSHLLGSGKGLSGETSEWIVILSYG